ncbi:hypothetical protein AALF85_05335 [Jeotgalicoccus halotolerans]|uniref:hypothetical protein n=1 Tax=Jeotgalicoccus halotolerans TaxID=157227 RepID=UPI003515B3A0
MSNKTEYAISFSEYNNLKYFLDKKFANVDTLTGETITLNTNHIVTIEEKDDK